MATLLAWLLVIYIVLFFLLTQARSKHLTLGYVEKDMEAFKYQEDVEYGSNLKACKTHVQM